MILAAAKPARSGVQVRLGPEMINNNSPKIGVSAKDAKK
jgi:hypothetical protein